jgi:hypothetical protein
LGGWGLGVWGWGFGFWGLGFGVWGLGFWVLDLNGLCAEGILCCLEVFDGVGRLGFDLYQPHWCRV